MSIDLEAIKQAVAKVKCEQDHLFFVRYFFKSRQDIKLIVNWHHRLFADVIDKVLSGEWQNVTVTVPPGSTKTEIFVINLIARGLALNPRARFLHLSGSDTLALLNSSTARDLITSDAYQAMWPMRLAEDAQSKKRWNVLVNDQPAGGVYATSLGGQITGFRAGHMAPGFQGAIIIDDPIKPEDAYSGSKLRAANRRLLTTVKSRKANPATPIIVVMQRIAQSDPVGFIEAGNLEGEWHHVKIPAVMDDAYLESLDPRYRAMMDEASLTINNRRSYWPYKEPLPALLTMEEGKGTDAEGGRISRHVFNSQYQQAPVALGGNIIRGEHFRRYRILPRMQYRLVIADTAQKTAEQNDYSVFGEYGIGVDGLLYVLDLIRGKWEAPELQRRAVAFWSKVKARNTLEFGQCRGFKVEDKSSGTGLIQTLKLPPYNIPIQPIERSKDKVTRVMDALPYLEAGQVLVPEEAPWVNDFIAEAEAFTADDTHDFDDQVDTLVDAVDELLQSGNKLKQWAALAAKGV